MRIEVTQADIQDGIPRLPGHCPIALAMKRCTGNIWYVDDEGISNEETELVIALPNQATEFIEDFDAELPVHPFAFDLEI